MNIHGSALGYDQGSKRWPIFEYAKEKCFEYIVISVYLREDWLHDSGYSCNGIGIVVVVIVVAVIFQVLVRFLRPSM